MFQEQRSFIPVKQIKGSARDKILHTIFTEIKKKLGRYTYQAHATELLSMLMHR